MFMNLYFFLNIEMLSNLSKSVSASFLTSNANKAAELPQETMTGMAVLEEVAKKMSIPKKTLSLYVPKHLLDVHHG